MLQHLIPPVLPQANQQGIEPERLPFHLYPHFGGNRVTEVDFKARQRLRAWPAPLPIG